MHEGGDDGDRLRLVPGLRVVRRGTEHLQVGLHGPRRTLLPRTAATEAAVVGLLAGHGVEADPGTAEALAILRRRGCLVTADDLARRERRRAASRVAVLGGDLAGARDLLTRAGVRVVAPGAGADVALVGGRGETDRDRLDPLIRRGTDHVVIRFVDGGAVVGPFVAPGVTACLRCIDAQQSITDPDHVPVLSRYVRASTRPRPDGVPDTDATLAALAVAWAVRDVVAHLDGHRPSTWSRTVFLDPEPSLCREEDWSRHPECGCCWSAHDPSSGTMEP